MANISDKCTTCHKKANIGEKYLTCGICKNFCHGNCENLSDKSLNAILNVKEFVIWICAACKSKDAINLLLLIPKLVDSQQQLSEQIQKLAEKVEAITKKNKSISC